MSFFSKYAFPFFFLFIVFSEQIFRAFMITMGIAVGSGQLQVMYIGTFVVSMFLCIHDIMHRQMWMKTRRVYFFSIAACCLYFITQFFYSQDPSRNYQTSLLSLGAVSIPAAIVGTHFARHEYMRYVDKLLPFFIVILGSIIGTVGMVAAQAHEIIRQTDEGGLDYQVISYYMAILYAFSAYYVFFSTARRNKSFYIMKWVMLFLMVFFATMCVMGGGRGAMVFLVLVTLFIVYKLISINKAHRTRFLLYIFIIGFIFAYIASVAGVWESDGFNRVATNIAHDDERTRLVSIAFKSFFDSPLFGHGLGSVWYEVGYYSHNIGLDLLVETGIVGTIIGVVIIFVMIKRMMKLCSFDKSFIFLMIIFIESLIQGSFSGYWLNTPTLWLVFGMVFSVPSKFFENYNYFSSKYYGSSINKIESNVNNSKRRRLRLV